MSTSPALVGMDYREAEHVRPQRLAMQSLSQQFLAFCKSKPADERYDYGNPTNCAVAQFEKHAGVFEAPRGSAELHEMGLWLPVQALPRTFGALAERLSA